MSKPSSIFFSFCPWIWNIYFYRYGYLTWEWVYGIRSYIYVGWIALLYKILKVLRWDSVRNLTLLPCIVQAVFTAISDTYFIAWIHKVSKSSRQAYWSVWCYMTNVFLAYCATRTLTNVAETNLTCIALYHYPWFKRQSGNSSFNVLVIFLLELFLNYSLSFRKCPVFMVRLCGVCDAPYCSHSMDAIVFLCS